MSQENVEGAGGVFDAWKAGDMDAVRDLYDPDVIVRPMSDWPEPGPWVGREAVVRQWEQMRDAWSADAVEPSSWCAGAGSSTRSFLLPPKSRVPTKAEAAFG